MSAAVGRSRKGPRQLTPDELVRLRLAVGVPPEGPTSAQRKTWAVENRGDRNDIKPVVEPADVEPTADRLREAKQPSAALKKARDDRDSARAQVSALQTELDRWAWALVDANSQIVDLAARLELAERERDQAAARIADTADRWNDVWPRVRAELDGWGM
ncbi:hypothetical protein [Actinophytocola sediminis]